MPAVQHLAPTASAEDVAAVLAEDAVVIVDDIADAPSPSRDTAFTRSALRPRARLKARSYARGAGDRGFAAR